MQASIEGRSRDGPQEEYRASVRVCRDRVKKAKAQLELKLVRRVKGNENGFSKYTGSKRKCRPTAQWDRGLSNKEHGKG